MNAHRIYKVVWPLSVALLIVWMVRVVCIGEVRIGPETCEPELRADDRVLYNRWAYGFRIKMGDSIVRIRPRIPSKGDMVTVRPSVLSSSALCVGRILALPGDTVWMGYGGMVKATRHYESGCIWPIRVPARGSVIDVKPWNADLYARLIRTDEGDSTAVVRDTALCVGGRDVQKYCFKRDYFWISSDSETNLFDSRTYGPVPHDALVGRLTFILYSNDRRRWMQPIAY